VRSILSRATVRLAAVVAVVVGLLGVPSVAASADSIRDSQWQLAELDAHDAWRLSTGAGVIVAVIDSGVDATHPDLAGQVLPGIDLVDPGGDGTTDPVGHGTTVAGLIAGRNDDSNGVLGLAPKARILPVRVLDKDNKYNDPGVVAQGIHWAVDHGATVINLSLGGEVRSDVLAEALSYAAAHDVVVVACTGNIEGTSTYRDVWYPAREPGVVAVAGLIGAGSGTPTPATSGPVHNGGRGGTSSADSLWSGSLTGPPTVLTAPAVNLLGARPGGYWHVQGTSFAAPLVAATAALIRAKYPQMTMPNVINRLIHTARDLGAPGRDPQYGFGEVDPTAALRTNVAKVTVNPLSGTPGMTSGSSAGVAPGNGTGQPTDGSHAPHDNPRAGQPPVASPPTKSASGGTDGATGTDGVGFAARAAAAERRLGPSVAIGALVALMLFFLGAIAARRIRRR
jgi:subtilisin family serine protease